VRLRICRAGRSPASRLPASGALALQSLKTFILFALVLLPTGGCFADIPWPEVKRRVTAENEKLSKRPGGRAGTYFVVCTVYYTPKESGFTAARGFDVTPVAARGLKGRKFSRDFLAAVKLEGFGRVNEPMKGLNYIRYQGGGRYSFASEPLGRGTTVLVPRQSAAARGVKLFKPGQILVIDDPEIRKIFGSTEWTVADTGGGLRRWQIDLYWGEDEPLGPQFLGRPKGTLFEYGYAEAKVK
jgi:hypothetical protein